MVLFIASAASTPDVSSEEKGMLAPGIAARTMLVLVNGQDRQDSAGSAVEWLKVKSAPTKKKHIADSVPGTTLDKRRCPTCSFAFWQGQTTFQTERPVGNNVGGLPTSCSSHLQQIYSSRSRRWRSSWSLSSRCSQSS